MGQASIDRSRRSLLALPLVWSSIPDLARAALSPPPEVRSELPGARLFGSGRLTFLLFSVYEARLWTGPQFDAGNFDQMPLALELEYARDFDNNDIADRSIEEMRRSGAIAPAKVSRWLTAMTQCFPDIVEGDRATGVQIPGVATRYFVNGQFTGEIRDAEFTRLFFGIWLSRHTSEPKLREALLAGSRSGS
ncbi:MAG: chalcone isomerase family protein [Burkholderiaceae bacterium]|nr:chalcone isomerase family protein [Burkholderiaceae bacterium]